VDVRTYYAYVVFGSTSQSERDRYVVPNTDDWPRAIVDVAAVFLEDLASLHGAP
jgi:hypothetical protein